jgi:O-antigen/teichoic acid export membrane protein
MYAAVYFAFRNIYPGLQLSHTLVSREQATEIWRYARQMIPAALSTRLLQGGVPSLIARFLPVRNVTYFTVTQKVLDYGADGIGRVGVITSPRASDWMARGYRENILGLARYGNRYSLCMWLILATFLLVYTEPLFRLWIDAEFAREARVLVPPLLAGYTLWMGQFISASILMGIGRYGRYSTGLLVEALLTLAALAVVLPLWGLAGGAVVLAIFMTLNRSLYLSLILCRELSLRPVSFLRSIYTLPLVLAAADVAFLTLLKRLWIPGNSWVELLTAGLLNTALLGAATLWLIAEPGHRQFLFDAVARRWRALATRERQPQDLP